MIPDKIRILLNTPLNTSRKRIYLYLVIFIIIILLIPVFKLIFTELDQASDIYKPKKYSYEIEPVGSPGFKSILGNEKGNITHISKMNIPRILHKAIKLKSGRVLIVGGNKGSNISAELFDTKTNQFELITENIQQNEKEFHSNVYEEPVLLPDNNVYYAGIVYDPHLNRILKSEGPVDVSFKRFDDLYSSKTMLNLGLLTLLQSFSDGSVLLGRNCNKEKVCSKVVLKDPLSKNSYITAKLNSTKSFKQAIKLKNGTVLILSVNRKIVGNLEEDLSNKTLEIYDPIAGQCRILRNKLALNKMFDQVNNAILFDESNMEDQIIVIVGEFDRSLFYKQKIALLDLKTNKIDNLQSYSFQKDYKCTIRNRYAIFSDSFFIYILDMKSKKLSKIFDPNISFKGQVFTPLNNGKVLITGGKYNSTNDALERSRFAAILTLKKNNSVTSKNK